MNSPKIEVALDSNTQVYINIMQIGNIES